MNDKRSDFPCPGIIRGGNTNRSQAEQGRTIAGHLDRKGNVAASREGRERVRQGNEWLAEKRRGKNPPKPWEKK